MALRQRNAEVDNKNSLGPTTNQQQQQSGYHDAPRPPWMGGYASFTPSTPGFGGYVDENRAGRNRQGVQGAHLNPLGLFLNPLGLFLRIPYRLYSVF